MSGVYPRISVVIVTFRRPNELSKCLKALDAANGENTSIEVFVGVNGEDAETLENLKVQSSKLRFKFVVESWRERVSPALARNKVVSKTSGEFIYFVDDDAYCSDAIFKMFYDSLGLFENLAAIGGPNLIPDDSTLFQRSSDFVFRSPLGASVSTDRYVPKGRIRACGEESLILCNLFVRADLVRLIGFDGTLDCCEESKLLDEIRKRGELVVYDPKLVVTHERRRTLIDFSRQVFKYARGRGQYQASRNFKGDFRYLAPSLCLLYALLFVIAFVVTDVSIIFLIPFLVYFGLISVHGVWFSVHEYSKFREILLSMWLLPILHISYGLGFVVGVVQYVRQKSST